MTTPAELQSTRELLGLTRDELAARLRVSPATIIKWERGERVTPPGLTHDLTALTSEFDALIDGLVDAGGDYVLPERGERDGWPARTWRHAAALARAERPAPITYETGPSYWATRAAQHWRKIGGAPEQWHDLADWAEQHHDDDTGAVLITQTGRIVGEATRIRVRDGQMYVATEATRDRWGLVKTPADMAAAAISRQVGEPVVMVKAWEVTRG